MLQPNRVLTAFEKKGMAIGTFIQNNSPENCEIAANAGLDFVIIDMEHGSFGIEAAANMIRAAEAAGAAPFIRIAEYSRSTVLKALDAGAVGILVPNASSAAHVQEVVAATQYAPLGTRGACPCVRSTAHGMREWNACTEWASANIMVVALIETKEGLENFAEIVQVKGLSAVGVGQFDLSMSMGLDGDHQHPDVVRKQNEMNALALANGVDVLGAIFDSEPAAVQASVARWRGHGARMLAISGDRFALASVYSGISKSLGLQ